jgi:MFS family permease
LAPVWQWLVPFRILDRGGKMRDTPRDVIMVDASVAGERGKNFGIMRTFDNLGAVCGVLIAMTFVGVLGLRQLFFLAALPSMVGAFLVYKTIKDPAAADKKIFKGFSIAKTSIHFKFLLLLSGFFALGAFSYSFLLLFAARSGIATRFIPPLYLLFTLVASLTSLQFGRLSDKLKSRKAVMLMSFLFWMAVCLTLILSQSIAAIIFAFIVYGLHRGSLDTIQNVFVAEMAPPEFKASSLGLFQLVIGVFALPASLGAGILWNSLGDLAPFKLSLGLTLIAAIILLFIKEQRKTLSA